MTAPLTEHMRRTLLSLASMGPKWHTCDGFPTASLHALERRGLIELHFYSVCLTDAGRETARKLTERAS